MKALIATLVAAAFCGSAFAADPVGKRTPNGGFEYYTSTMVGQGSVKDGCYLPMHYKGHATLGYNPKRVELGDITVFQDCFIAKPVVVTVVEKTVEPMPAPVVVAPVVAPAPAPVVVAPAPVYVEPAPQPKRIRE